MLDVPTRERSRLDLLCTLGLAMAGATLSWWALAQIDEGLYQRNGTDIWFEADQPRILSNLTDRQSDHYRTSVHPIFSLLFYPICTAIMLLGDIAPLAAAKILVSISGAATAGLFYRSMRNLGLTVTGALIFSAALLASASFTHWFAVVETYAFAALSITLGLWVVTQPGLVSTELWILGSAATLSVTITNWTFGLATAFFRLPWRAFLRVSVTALVLVAALAVVQKVAFPSSGLFFNPRALVRERHYTQVAQPAESGGGWMPLANLRSMLFYSAVAPTASREMNIEAGRSKLIVSNQHSPLRDEGLLGLLATTLWVVTLGLGLWKAVTWPRRDVVLGLFVFLAGQMALHLVYGNITFLYAAHFFPVLLAIAALGAVGRTRWLATGFAAAFVFVGGYANIEQLRAASALANMVLLTRGGG
ncbi:hypothetical protein ACFQX4_25530 [Roseomonas sp. GCM10028921]